MQQLSELQKRMAKIEEEKLKLLKREQEMTANLSFKARVLGEELAEAER